MKQYQMRYIIHISRQFKGLLYKLIAAQYDVKWKFAH